MAGTARRAALITLVVGAIVVAALALWQLRVVLALLFLAFTLAAAMRPGVDSLHRRGLPRALGVTLHYLLLIGLVALFLWLVVPRAVTQIQSAIGNVPTAAHHSTGIKHRIFVGLDKWLKHLPSGTKVVHGAVSVGLKAFEILIAIFFTLAVAAYWIFEREHAMRLVTSLIPRPKRKLVRDTWDLIDLKLGAYVRGQALLVVLVGAILSVLFLLIGEPYWILVGSFAGIVEIIPVIGPLSAGAIAVAVGFTASWHVALFAGLCVLGVRVIEDYLVAPRVLGHSVGLSPLVILVSITGMGILFGGATVPLAIPVAAVLSTLLDVVVRDKDPAEEEVPSVLFPAKEAER